jgi:cell division protein FtsB
MRPSFIFWRHIYATMTRVFSRQQRHPFAQQEEMAPPQSVTMDQWNDMKEMDPPKKAGQNSPARSKSTTTISTMNSDDAAEDTVENGGDYGLSCTGLLGEELLMDTTFGQFARASLQATAESLRKLSDAVVKPIQKNAKSEDNVVMIDHEALAKENERLKRENTWLAEENQSLRGGTYDDEDILSSGKRSV